MCPSSGPWPLLPPGLFSLQLAEEAYLPLITRLTNDYVPSVTCSTAGSGAFPSDRFRFLLSLSLFLLQD